MEKKISASTLKEIEDQKRESKKVTDTKSLQTLFENSNNTIYLLLKWDIDYGSCFNSSHVEAEAEYDVETGILKWRATLFSEHEPYGSE